MKKQKSSTANLGRTLSLKAPLSHSVSTYYLWLLYSVVATARNKIKFQNQVSDSYGAIESWAASKTSIDVVLILPV